MSTREQIIQERMAATIRQLEKRVEALEAHERSLTWKLSTKDLKLVDAGTAGATYLAWVELEIDSTTGYLRVLASK